MLAAAIAAAEAIATRLRRSQEALAAVFPVEPITVSGFDEQVHVQIDALLKRFEQLQDALSNNLGRLVLLSVGDDVRGYNARAAFDRLGALGALRDAERFFEITKLRHRIAHEYPSFDAEKQAARLNDVWRAIPDLLSELDAIASFVGGQSDPAR